jgi:hypothetical protein
MVSVHAPTTVEYVLSRRKNQPIAAQLGLTLADLEHAFGCSSAVAMVRIREGRLNHPEWERLYTRYLGLLRPKPATPKPAEIHVDAAEVAAKREAAKELRQVPLEEALD